MRAFAVFASLFFFILIFWLGTGGDVLLPLTVFFPQFHLIVFSTLIAILILGRDSATLTPIARFIETHRYTIFPLLGLIFGICINLFVFKTIPHIQDGIHYKYMAELFAHGRLSSVMPTHYEFFSYPFFMVDGTRQFSLFMPGFPAFLSPFALAGLTSLANPILTAMNILIIGTLANMLFGPRTSTYSMLLFVFSPFMMTMSGTWMPHPFTALLTLAATISFIKFWLTRQFYLPIVAGCALGWMVFTRPQNALFFAILFAVVGCLVFDLKTLLKTAALSLGPILLGIVVLATYNQHFTGSPTTFVQDIYFNATEPVHNGHRIGLGTGCIHCNGESLPEGGMSWRHGVTVTRERLGPLLMETFPHPLFFGFVLVALIINLNRTKERLVYLFLLSLSVTPVAGYFLFYFNGNVFGPRYLYEGAIFFSILVGSGIDLIYGWLNERNSRILSTCVTSFLIAGFLYLVSQTLPSAYIFYRNGFWGVDERLKELAESEDFYGSVIFVSAVDVRNYGSGLVAMNLPEFETSKTIFVRDLGDESNSTYMHHMKGREFYRVRYSPFGTHKVQPKRTAPVLPEHVIHVEMEDKFPPYLTAYGTPDYCNIYPVQNHVYPYLGFDKIIGVTLSRRGALFCRLTDANQRFTFGQYFPTNGRYAATMGAVSGSEFGDLEVTMEGGLISSIDLDRQSGSSLNEVRFEIQVSEGLHTFQIALRPGSLPERNTFMIDFIRFVRVRDAG